MEITESVAIHNSQSDFSAFATQKSSLFEPTLAEKLILFTDINCLKPILVNTLIINQQALNKFIALYIMSAGIVCVKVGEIFTPYLRFFLFFFLLASCLPNN